MTDSTARARKPSSPGTCGSPAPALFWSSPRSIPPSSPIYSCSHRGRRYYDHEMETSRGTRIRYVRGLDGLRGVAVAGVLLFHGDHLQGGYLGVDLFFVLSGYLITSLLLAETATTGGVGLKAFWARRARRLLPALALMLIGVAFYARFVAQPSD